jgi:hypothetical protein
MTPSIIKAGVLALTLAIQVEAARYTLDPTDNYSGANFFNLWDFVTVSLQSGVLV